MKLLLANSKIKGSETTLETKMNEYVNVIMGYAKDGNIEMLKQSGFIDGPNNFINYPDLKGNTLLYYALQNGRQTVVEELLKYDGKLLDVACFKNDSDITIPMDKLISFLLLLKRRSESLSNITFKEGSVQDEKKALPDLINKLIVKDTNSRFLDEITSSSAVKD